MNNEFVSIRSEIEMSKLSMNNQFKSISENFDGVSDKFVEINTKLEKQSKTIAGVKGEMTISKIQTEMKNDIKIISEKQDKKLLETDKKFEALTSRFNDKFKKQNDKIEGNVQGLIDECEQIKKANKIQENINNEFKSNIEQIDTIKNSVTNLKSKQTEHEQEIVKVKEDLSLAINQRLTNVSAVSYTHLRVHPPTFITEIT